MDALGEIRLFQLLLHTASPIYDSDPVTAYSSTVAGSTGIDLLLLAISAFRQRRNFNILETFRKDSRCEANAVTVQPDC